MDLGDTKFTTRVRFVVNGHRLFTFSAGETFYAVRIALSRPVFEVIYRSELHSHIAKGRRSSGRGSKNRRN